MDGEERGEVAECLPSAPLDLAPERWKGRKVEGRDSEQIDPTTPSALKKLRAAYKSSLTKINADKEKRLRPLTETYGKSLASLVSSLTRAGRIEEASIVEQKRLEVQGNPDMKRFEGTWEVRYANGTSRRYRINSAGQMEWVTGDNVSATTRIAKKGNDYVLDFNDGKLERIPVRGVKLIVEHFDPSSRYPKVGPDTTGCG